MLSCDLSRFYLYEYVPCQTAREEMGHTWRSQCRVAMRGYTGTIWRLDRNERSSGEYSYGKETLSFNSVRHNDGAHVHIQQKGGDTTTRTGTQEHRTCAKLRGMRRREIGNCLMQARHHARFRARVRRGTCNNGRFTNNQHHEAKRLYNDISTSNIHSCFLYVYTRHVWPYISTCCIYIHIPIYNEISENAKAPGQV